MGNKYGLSKAQYERAKRNGISKVALNHRVEKGWNLEVALTEKPRKPIDWEDVVFGMYKGEDLLSIGNVFEISDELNISVSTVKKYHSKSWKERSELTDGFVLVEIGKYSIDEDEFEFEEGELE